MTFSHRVQISMQILNLPAKSIIVQMYFWPVDLELACKFDCSVTATVLSFL